MQEQDANTQANGIPFNTDLNTNLSCTSMTNKIITLLKTNFPEEINELENELSRLKTRMGQKIKGKTRTLMEILFCGSLTTDDVFCYDTYLISQLLTTSIKFTDSLDICNRFFSTDSDNTKPVMIIDYQNNEFVLDKGAVETLSVQRLSTLDERHIKNVINSIDWNSFLIIGRNARKYKLKQKNNNVSNNEVIDTYDKNFAKDVDSSVKLFFDLDFDGISGTCALGQIDEIFKNEINISFNANYKYKAVSKNHYLCVNGSFMYLNNFSSFQLGTYNTEFDSVNLFIGSAVKNENSETIKRNFYEIVSKILKEVEFKSFENIDFVEFNNFVRSVSINTGNKAFSFNITPSFLKKLFQSAHLVDFIKKYKPFLIIEKYGQKRKINSVMEIIILLENSFYLRKFNTCRIDVCKQVHSYNENRPVSIFFNLQSFKKHKNSSYSIFQNADLSDFSHYEHSISDGRLLVSEVSASKRNFYSTAPMYFLGRKILKDKVPSLSLRSLTSNLFGFKTKNWKKTSTQVIESLKNNILNKMNCSCPYRMEYRININGCIDFENKSIKEVNDSKLKYIYTDQFKNLLLTKLRDLEKCYCENESFNGIFSSLVQEIYVIGFMFKGNTDTHFLCDTAKIELKRCVLKNRKPDIEQVTKNDKLKSLFKLIDFTNKIDCCKKIKIKEILGLMIEEESKIPKTIANTYYKDIEKISTLNNFDEKSVKINIHQYVKKFFTVQNKLMDKFQFKAMIRMVAVEKLINMQILMESIIKIFIEEKLDQVIIKKGKQNYRKIDLFVDSSKVKNDKINEIRKEILVTQKFVGNKIEFTKDEKLRLLYGLEKYKGESKIYVRIVNDISLGFTFTRTNGQLKDCKRTIDGQKEFKRRLYEELKTFRIEDFTIIKHIENLKTFGIVLSYKSLDVYIKLVEEANEEHKFFNKVLNKEATNFNSSLIETNLPTITSHQVDESMSEFGNDIQYQNDVDIWSEDNNEHDIRIKQQPEITISEEIKGDEILNIEKNYLESNQKTNSGDLTQFKNLEEIKTTLPTFETNINMIEPNKELVKINNEKNSIKSAEKNIYYQTILEMVENDSISSQTNNEIVEKELCINENPVINLETINTTKKMTLDVHNMSVQKTGELIKYEEQNIGENCNNDNSTEKRTYNQIVMHTVESNSFTCEPNKEKNTNEKKDIIVCEFLKNEHESIVDNNLCFSLLENKCIKVLKEKFTNNWFSFKNSRTFITSKHRPTKESWLLFRDKLIKAKMILANKGRVKFN